MNPSRMGIREKQLKLNCNRNWRLQIGDWRLKLKGRQRGFRPFSSSCILLEAGTRSRLRRAPQFAAAPVTAVGALFRTIRALRWLQSDDDNNNHDNDEASDNDIIWMRSPIHEICSFQMNTQRMMMFVRGSIWIWLACSLSLDPRNRINISERLYRQHNKPLESNSRSFPSNLMRNNSEA